MIKETSRGHSKSLCRDLALVFMCLLSGLILVSVSQSAALRGKVTSVQGNAIELDAGAEKGIRLGDPGRVYYVVRIEGKEKPIYVAKFKITRLSERSSVGQVEEKTVDIRPGYFVEISSIREGELEIKSEPSGARVSVDGKEAGKTPLALSKIKPGSHRIRVAAEGYEPYEEQVGVSEGERKEILASLKKVAGHLVVRTEPSGAAISMDGKPVGVEPYEGKDLTPGKHKIKVVKEGYETWEREQTVEAGKKVEVIAKLKTIESGLAIDSEPSGAKVYLDGNPVGVSPYEGKDLSPGPMKVRVTKEGYEPWDKNVTVEAGKRVEVLANMKEKKVEVPPPPSSAPIAKQAASEEKAVKAGEPPKVSKETDLSNKSVDAPVWKAGNKWFYRNPAGKFWVNEVVEVKKDVYIFKSAGRPNLYAFDKKTMHAVYAIGTDNTVTKITDDKDTFRFFDFPLFVGKKWGVLTKEGSSTVSGEFEVEGAEDLQTPAGKFTTFRILLKQTNLSSKKMGWIRYWYAPEVGQRVKQEIDKSGYWAKITWLVDNEMIAYELK